MQDIKQREEKIKEKRKMTTFKQFVKECGSRRPLTFYKNKGHISRYPVSGRATNIVSVEEHAEIRDNIIKYNTPYSGDLFTDIAQILSIVPLATVNHFGQNENCNFSDTAYNAKNIYLSIATTRGVENAAYVFNCKDESKYLFNSINVFTGSENVFESNDILHSYNVFFSEVIMNCSNIRLSTNLIGCHECIKCNDLQDVSYYINNKKYDKEVYKQEKQKILNDKKELKRVARGKIFNIQCSNIINGTNLFNCHDVTNAYYCINVSKGRNILLVSSNEDNSEFYDVFMGGRSTNFYGVCDAGGFSNNCYCIAQCAGCASMYYSMYCEGCSYCLGCIGLKNKSFCILNKQYTKEERYELANKIFQKMESDGTLGNFFPGSMNPFYFNDTAAYLIDDTFTKEEVEKEGYLRRDEEIKVDIPQGADLVTTAELEQYQGFDAQGNWEIDPEILKKVIKDEKGNYYRIVKMEYDFLMKHALPLPDLHWLDRIKLGFRFK